MGAAEGNHQLIWDLDKQGVKMDSTNVVFAVEYRGEYCVVDLSAGANASSYPVSYLNEPPNGGFNTSAYKTTNLVLRRIEPGTFTMGRSGEKHQVTLTKPYYIGIFEVTQTQYQLVTGSNPSFYKSNTWPVNNVSWTAIRGDMEWGWVSDSSFMGRLQARTGLEFDLPTEAQWEYACRAGTTSAFNNGGSTSNDLNNIARWPGNTSGSWGPVTVGAYQPNAWGLYDMHGNVQEWCFDWYGSLSSTAATDPEGPYSGTERVRRGGSYCSSYKGDYTQSWSLSEYFSYSRASGPPTNGYAMHYSNRDYTGFRLVRTPRTEEAWQRF